ncbi:MAG: DUF3347 domain-containing protein [Taibaiella sp.]|nr:DUF3347 domain-containing protein [Taibaiella sp.]
MKKLIAIIAAGIMISHANAQDGKKLLGAYLPVKDALIAGDSKAAAEAANALHVAIRAEPDFAGKGDLLEQADRLSHAGSVEKQRAAFAELSDEMWRVIKKLPIAGQDVYYQYCPMKKAHWISAEASIKNPYYGSSMLTCGRVDETKKK